MISSNNSGFSILIKSEEDTVNSCPNKNIGMKKKKNFVQIYLFGVTGEVLITHKEFPSEEIAGYTSLEHNEVMISSIKPRLKNEIMYFNFTA